MSESEDLALRAQIIRSVVEDALSKARALRKKAERLEKEGDRLRAEAAKDLAEYLEGAAAELK
jgi:uncharacterized protein Yka (UPF0111/DUF47 family)